MNTYIGHVHSSYRIAGVSSPGALQARLDDLLRRDVPAELDRLLARHEDPAVHIVRRVQARAVLRTDAGVPTRRTAETLSRCFAAAITAEISAGSPENVVTFPSQAEYVAGFLRDLLEGSAWGCWYYGSFQHVRNLPLPEAVAAILSENRDCLPGILAAMHKSGALDRALRILSPAHVQSLWTAGLDTLQPEDALRPLFAAAMTVVDRLGIWRDARPGETALFGRWMASGIAVPDWGSRAALTDVVAGVWRWLAERGLLLNPTSSRISVAQAVEGMEWLETEVLADALAGLPERRFAAPQAAGVSAEIRMEPFQRPSGRRATPRQTTLLEQLGVVMKDFRFAPGPPDSSENKIRVYALLVSRFPEWAGADIAPPVIERLLAACASLVLHSSHLPDRAGASQLQASSFDAETGKLAAEIMARARAPQQGGALSSCDDEVETPSAGLFLLLRAVTNLRLRAVCQSAGYVSFPALLAALALRWTGGPLDAAISIFSGWEGSFDDLVGAWRAITPQQHERFHFEFLSVMRAQRLLQADELKIHSTPGAIVAGCDTEGLWPLGCLAPIDAGPFIAAAQWMNPWEEATGRRPVLSRAGDSQSLLAALDSLADGTLGLDAADLAIALTCCSVLRSWARWLRGFSGSSAPFLLEQFIRRPGWVTRRDGRIVVYLPTRPLDIVLELAGYFDELAGVRFERSGI